MIMNKNCKSNLNNKKSKHPKLIIVMGALVCIVIIGLLAGCGDADIEDKGDITEADPAEVIKLDIESVKNDLGDQVFNISMEEFISSFNSLYAKDNSSGYLGDIDKWQMYTAAPTLGSTKEMMLYIFSQEPEARSVPQIKIYADSPRSSIYQISIAYDDHSYSPETYDMYRELLHYTLKTMMPDKSDKYLAGLAEALLIAVDESFTTESSTASHNEAAYGNEIMEIYPYYVAGDTMEVRLVPAR